ncbi:MAG: hypothetical protein A3K19_10540 [Lentisphaerae bacterium RIFOXYB12_FULL_65_16]|nr:MAG: hypothetical protein A3K18_32995 [Lentisphaerae bacterium RIFOXYA12_64_32]OGV87947.1 MAG: hypothetical protein A3K19_10540 [Lentisphaerae bacterium RIFOXYB12_FULL_65_16]
MTVTRAFNPGAPVAEKTRTRILCTARRLGYVPNALARGLAGGRTGTVGIVWGMGGTPSAATFIQGLSLCWQRRGYLVYPVESLSDPVHTCNLLREFAARRVDAVVLQDTPNGLSATPAAVALLKGFRAVVVCSAEKLPVEFDVIHQDRTAGVKDAVTHFFQSGRRRIAYAQSSPWETNRVKTAAFLKTLAKNGVSGGDKRIIAVPAPGLPDDFVSALNQYASGKRRFALDALLCSCDEGALAALGWLRRRGLRVPADVALCGTNAEPWGAHVAPPLASLARHDEQVGALIEELLVSRLETPDAPPRRHYVPFEFIRRESAG